MSIINTIYRLGKKGTERFSNLLKVTQIVNSRARI